MPSTMYIGGRKMKGGAMRGCGMGSVLLNRGGPGVGSSYTSIDDYIKTTGVNPARGSGLGEKLGSLIVKPVQKKMKNIQFSM
jgi:hypothetical protein